MDVVAFFLNAEVESDIYMEQPEGYHFSGLGGTRQVCHLKTVLYGIREVSKAWNVIFTSWHIS